MKTKNFYKNCRLAENILIFNTFKYIYVGDGRPAGFPVWDAGKTSIYPSPDFLR